MPDLVLYTESYRLIYNTVIESSPLLLAIKQGSDVEVRSLLQQLPREETVRLIINGPDIKSILSSKLTKTEYEKKITDEVRINYTLTDEQWHIILSALSNTIQDAIDALSNLTKLLSCLQLAAARGSPDLITLLLEYIANSKIREFFKSGYTIGSIGHIITSHNS